MAHGVIMILLPTSIFLFLIIVLVKVICFFYVGSKKRSKINRRNREGKSSNYGEFNDEELDKETETVIGVYLKIMEKFTFRTAKSTPDPNKHAIEDSSDVS